MVFNSTKYKHNKERSVIMTQDQRYDMVTEMYEATKICKGDT